MGDIIISMFKAIFGSAFISGSASLTSSVAGYNQTAFNFANTINDTAVKPVAASVVAIILVLEFARISSRYEQDQAMGTQQVGMAMLKAVLLIVAIQNVDLILGAMNEAGDLIIGKTTGETPTQGVTELPSELVSAVDDMGTVDKAGLMLVLFVPWALSTLGGVALQLVILIRFAELYILSAAATLPLAFIGHPDTKQIAVGYMRRYGATVLHGVMIIIIVAIYARFQGAMFDPADLVPKDLTEAELANAVANGNAADLILNNSAGDRLLGAVLDNIGQLILAPVLFIVLVFSSSKLARAMLGEG